VAQTAGGPTDVAARIFASRFSEVLGQQTVVDNRHGAGGSVAGEITVHSPADGYTLMVAANGTIAIAPHLIKLSYDARKDLTPVALFGNSPLGLMVYPGLKVNSLKDLIELATQRPGKINFGSSAAGATSQLAGELLKIMANIQIIHVPYKGAGAAIVGVMSGEIEMLISGLSSSLPYIKQKQVHLIAVSSAKRVSILPEVPTMAETVSGYDVSSWYAMLAPSATPKIIIDKLNKAAGNVLANPEIQKRLVSAGLEVENLSPKEIQSKLESEVSRWGKVIKAAGIKSE
jgi:tripartite-type tricarboxylate transporter receptor subunit TctC